MSAITDALDAAALDQGWPQLMEEFKAWCISRQFTTNLPIPDVRVLIAFLAIYDNGHLYIRDDEWQAVKARIVRLIDEKCSAKLRNIYSLLSR